MPDDNSDSPGTPTTPPCKRCGGSLELLTHFPGRAANPAYRIFGCSTCGFIEWIVDIISLKG